MSSFDADYDSSSALAFSCASFVLEELDSPCSSRPSSPEPLAAAPASFDVPPLRQPVATHAPAFQPHVAIAPSRPDDSVQALIRRVEQESLNARSAEPRREGVSPLKGQVSSGFCADKPSSLLRRSCQASDGDAATCHPASGHRRLPSCLARRSSVRGRRSRLSRRRRRPRPAHSRRRRSPARVLLSRARSTSTRPTGALTGRPRPLQPSRRRRPGFRSRPGRRQRALPASARSRRPSPTARRCRPRRPRPSTRLSRRVPPSSAARSATPSLRPRLASRPRTGPSRRSRSRASR